MRAADVSFGAALEGLLPRLRRTAIALTGNVALADDLVQDCLERAWRSRSSLAARDVPFAWLRMILRNAHIDWLRRHRNEAAQVKLDDFEETLFVLPPDHVPLALDLVAALQRVPLDQRMVLVLSALEGLSYREIADELDIPIGTVMSRLARARETVRAYLDRPQRAGMDARP